VKIQWSKKKHKTEEKPKHKANTVSNHDTAIVIFHRDEHSEKGTVRPLQPVSQAPSN